MIESTIYKLVVVTQTADPTNMNTNFSIIYCSFLSGLLLAVTVSFEV